jgi:tetratricopeptide (TPR) repeat protein
LIQAKLKYYESEMALIQADGCSSEAATGLCGVYLNLSLIFYKQNDYTVARFEAQKALDLDDKNAKAWFRRGQANLALQKLQDSISDFETGLKLEPKNSDLIKNLAQAKDQHRKNGVKESTKKNLASLDGLYDNFVTGDLFGSGKGIPGLDMLGMDKLKEKMKGCQGMMGGLGLGLSDDDF